jgi:hypothetical protein
MKTTCTYSLGGASRDVNTPQRGLRDLESADVAFLQIIVPAEGRPALPKEGRVVEPVVHAATHLP